MADTHEFWSHGVTVVPQHTPHLTQDNNGLFMAPLSWGTVVRQNNGTSNWFHIPIPTPTIVDDWRAKAYHAFLSVHVEDHAEIEKIEVHSTVEFDGTQPAPLNNVTSFGLRSFKDRVKLNLPDRPVFGPMVISVFVRFDGDGNAEERSVLFIGAGISFEEKR